MGFDRPDQLLQNKIAIRAEDFYAARCIDALGAGPRNGVIRISLVHYNSLEDVNRLIENLGPIIDRGTGDRETGENMADKEALQ